ncbi:MAG: ABC transporter ATP-binding protein [Lachnospiraceae bacterium]|nr:ABC transporter ATP-binding protein [Lachnospiraceae bacterium]
MIEVNHLVKRYGSNHAVDDLSFRVERGQIYGFLGPNGAGKSTTMNILTGYIAPSSGEVKINGHDILEDAEAARKCIGYLPEIPPIYPEMTVLEYLTFAAELKRLPGKSREALILEAMELTGVVEVQRRLIKNLSKGFRQRVGLAQAILGFPEIIILDEPMVGLDPKQIIEVRELIKKLSEKHTVILSSHILSEISAICDHIMIISHGKLVASDTPERLTSLMKGSASLELTVRCEKHGLHQLLKDTSGITSFEILDSPEQGAHDVLIKTEGTTDLREKLFYELASRKMALLRMQQSHVSLEDVFLELTENEETEGEENEDGSDL